MKVTKEQLNLEKGLTKEWLLTNGIGGYSSSTILNCNTRKYHGLLVASLTPPARRHVIVSKVDESITINDQKFDLYTNVCNNNITDGYKFQEEFEKDYLPIFTYKVNGVEIKKIIAMEHGKNTTCILYRIKNINAKTKLTIAPIVNFRDFHQMCTDYDYNLRQDIKENKVKLVINNNIQYPVYFKTSVGKYIKHEHDIFYNMSYPEEEKRGFYPNENLVVPGVYEINVDPNEEKEITFVCSLEENIDEIDAKDIINSEIIRINKLLNNSILFDSRKPISKEKNNKDLIKDYIIATDNFVAYRPSFGLHTLLAGYPWFLDWGRDAMISFEGLLLIPKRSKTAKEVLQTFVRNLKYGLIPNGYSGFDNRPLYNSADASLLLFEEVYKYLKYTEDYKFIEQEIYPALKDIINSYRDGIDLDNNNIRLDQTDNLIISGTEDTQNTWMDVKCGDEVATPRFGKVVEINALWYNALKIIEQLTIKYVGKNDSIVYAEMAKATKKSFEKKFYNKEKNCLYDVLGVDKVRPNQLFALSLTYPVIDPNSLMADNIMQTVKDELLNEHGLQTLNRNDDEFVGVYEGSPYKRDMSYHQGITWPWLWGLYYDALKNMQKSYKTRIKKKQISEEIDNFINNVKEKFNSMFYEDGIIGSISELYDTDEPKLAKGALAQAWSVAEVFRIILGK